MKVSLHKLKVITRWTLFAFVLLYIISGFGVLYYNAVEKLTFGLLTKALSYKIHVSLLIPFSVLLITHIYLSMKNIINKERLGI